MKKLFTIITIFLASSVCLTIQAQSQSKSPSVTISGRALQNADGSVVYDYVGTTLSCRFSGRSVSMRAKDSGISYHNVFVDGKFIQRIKLTGKEPHTVLLASGLSNGFHTLRLQKSTEGSFGCTTVMDILPANAKIPVLPAEPAKRFIEVYGDSYSCGYGTEAASKKERFKLETEDCNHAYGPIIARYFDADYSLVAHSGMGIVRNYNDSVTESRRTMLSRSDRVFDDYDTTAIYDFARRPDIVIINLGTNDMSTTVLPSTDQYCRNYLRLITMLRSHYGNVPILCVTPQMANLYLQTNVREAVSRASKKFEAVYLAPPLEGIINTEKDLGADYHPNYQGQRKIAMTLIPFISRLTGWQLESKKIE